MSDKTNSIPDVYVNKGFDQSFNDVNNNQIIRKNAEQLELQEKNTSIANFVYKEGGFGWIVGVNYNKFNLIRLLVNLIRFSLKF